MNNRSAYFPKWHFLLPVLSALLLWLSYHPANISYLVWIALVPWLLYIILEPKTWRLCLMSWVGGFIFFLVGLFWLRHVTWAGLIIVPFILAFYWLLFGWLVKLILRKTGRTVYLLAIPLLWVFLEYVRSWLLTGFPWFFLGHTQYRWLSFIQISDLAGVYAISFIIALVNALVLAVVFQLIKEKKMCWRSRPIVWLFVLVVVMFTGSLIYGYGRMKSCEVRLGPLLGIVQGNIEQRLKVKEGMAPKIFDKYFNASLRLIKQRPDIIIWPETMYPNLVIEGGLAREHLQDIARACRAHMLIGAVSDDGVEGTKQFYNSAYFVGPEGILGRYDKTHLVPIGEYIPLRQTFPWLDKIVLELSAIEKVTQIEPGKSLEPLVWQDKKFGVLICYESIFPELIRASVNKGADFIINISNDGWFKDSAELEQILVISIFRAVENKVGLVRATNTGISAFISPLGDYAILKDSTGQYKEIEGTLLDRVRLRCQHTFYTRWGDYFPFLCLMVLVIIVLGKLFKIT